MLDKKGEGYQAFSYDTHPMLAKVMVVAGMKTVPQVWHDKQHIGGADDLERHLTNQPNCATIATETKSE